MFKASRVMVVLIAPWMAACADLGEQLAVTVSALGAGFAAPTAAGTYPLAPTNWMMFPFTMLDVNGDGTPDVVQEAATIAFGPLPARWPATAFGTSDADAHWNVWLNTGGVLAAAPVPFQVPRLA